MNTSIAAYSATEAALIDLATKYKGVVYDVATPTGMTDAKAAYKDINAHSITLEKAREKEKAESLAYGRFVDSEARRISERLDALRLPIKSIIETETKRLEREREEAVRKEAERIAAEDKARKDAEEAVLAAHRAEIARRQAELDQAEKKRLEEDAAARRKIEDEQRAARLKIEEEERAARKAREEADRIAKSARDAEEARLKAERDAIDAAKREADRLAWEKHQAEEKETKRLRDIEDAKAREIQRQKNEILDANQMLQSFCTRFGHLPQFESVVGIIESFLQKKAA